MPVPAPGMLSAKKRSEERRLETERLHLQARKLETTGVLAAGIAHNFNNLLGVVIRGLDLTLLQMPAAGPLRCPLEQALQASLQARDLTRCLLGYSGMGQYVTKTFNLNELLMEKAPFLKSAIPDSVKLTLEPGPEALFIQADPASIEQVVMNLVTNASESYDG